MTYYPIEASNGVSGLPVCSLKRINQQRGATLIELMVGIAIGLITVAVALSALMVSRGVSGTVSETSQMQQDAAYAFRVIGQQIRQAGSTKLNLAFNKTDPAAIIDATDPVAFETTFDRTADTINGKDAPGTGEYKLLVGYQNYTESIFPNGVATSQFRDCLGQQPALAIIKSGFTLVKPLGASTGELKCAGSDNAAQPIISKVADIQVRYLMQEQVPGSGNPTLIYSTAADVGTNWRAVLGVEVCLELAGDETIDTAGATYRDCSWKTGVAEKDKGNKTRMVFRNTFQLRSQNSL